MAVSRNRGKPPPSLFSLVAGDEMAASDVRKRKMPSQGTHPLGTKKVGLNNRVPGLATMFRCNRHNHNDYTNNQQPSYYARHT